MKAGSESSASDLDSVEEMLELMSEQGRDSPTPDDAALSAEEREDQQETFYNQTIGAVFVWTLENLIMGLVHFCVHLLAEALAAPAPGGLLVSRWCAYSILLATLTMVAGNCLVAFVERAPGVFSRHYMMITQAYCGTLSFVGLVFSAVAWKAARTAHWRDIFVQSSSPLLGTAKLLVVVANNVQWVLSLLLTYSCTPFGQSNSAFVHLPVAAAATLFLVLVNEAATNGLVVCQGYSANVFTYLVTNGAICTSFVFHAWSAVEWDYLEIFPPFMHSTLVTRQRFDVYALLHGALLFAAVTCYGAIARLSQTTFFGTMFVLLFIMLCTAVHAFDLRYVASTIFAGDEDDERRARALHHELEREREAARAATGLAPATRRHRAEEGHRTEKHRHTKERHHAAEKHPPKPRRRRAERHRLPEPASDGSETPDEPEVPDLDRDELRRRGDFFRRSTARAPLPTGLTLFPNIPVSLRRTAR